MHRVRRSVAALAAAVGALWHSLASAQAHEPLGKAYRLGLEETTRRHSVCMGEWVLALAYALAMLAVVAYVLRLVAAQKRMAQDVSELRRQLRDTHGKEGPDPQHTGSG